MVGNPYLGITSGSPVIRPQRERSEQATGLPTDGSGMPHRVANLLQSHRLTLVCVVLDAFCR